MRNAASRWVTMCGAFTLLWSGLAQAVSEPPGTQFEERREEGGIIHWNEIVISEDLLVDEDGDWINVIEDAILERQDPSEVTRLLGEVAEALRGTLLEQAPPLSLQIEGALILAEDVKISIRGPLSVRAHALYLDENSVLHVNGDLLIRADTYDALGVLSTSPNDDPFQRTLAGRDAIPGRDWLPDEGESTHMVESTEHAQVAKITTDSDYVSTGANGASGGAACDGGQGTNGKCKGSGFASSMGQAGGNGCSWSQSGGDAGQGQNGQNGGNIVLDIYEYWGGTFNTSGGNGGSGGRGGNGGKGGNAACCSFDCMSGGSGGRGGNGGKGGNGGNAGYVRVDHCIYHPRASSTSTFTSGGQGGAGGPGGSGGAGGSTSCRCVSGAAGASGSSGYAGTSGLSAGFQQFNDVQECWWWAQFMKTGAPMAADPVEPTSPAKAPAAATPAVAKVPAAPIPTVAAIPGCTPTVWNNRAYQFCPSAKTWDAAMQYCNKYGYQLATLGDSAEDAWTNTIVDSLNSAATWWIGLNDTRTEATFVWDDGTSASFRLWGPGQPDNFGNEDCGEINSLGTNWNDAPCTKNNPFICETNAVPGCYSSSYGGKVYHFCMATLNWSDAGAYCRKYGKKLVTVNDASEDSWLVARASTYDTGYWWIGLNDITSEGTFVWDDGSTSTYTRWSGGPNNQNNEDCVHFNCCGGTGWNDMTCDMAMSFVCE